MVTVHFTPNLQRHVQAPTIEVKAATVSAALEAVFAGNPHLRSYIVDDRGSLRKHMAVFVDGVTVRDRERLSDELGPESEVFVMQALSGG